MPQILRHLRVRIAIVAFLFVCGTQWFVLQSVAWASMLISNSQHVSLVEAVKETFDGEHPCELCRKVEKERQHEKQNKVLVVSEKLVLFHQDVETLAPPVLEFCKSNYDAVSFSAPQRNEQPILQPPRWV